MESRPPDVRGYSIGWLCALPIELAAAQILLDKTHEGLPHDPNDDTEYTLGSIGSHNVVIGCLSAGQLGIGAAATVATRMRAKFPNLRFGLMVGVGGGSPGKKDVRLGDVVVSQPVNGYGGVIQYKFGKQDLGGFTPTGFLNAPPQLLLQALTNLQSHHYKQNNDISPYLPIFEGMANFSRPTSEDILFMPEYDHIKDEDICRKCDKSKKMERGSRKHNSPALHYGTIASGDCVMKNGVRRDLVSADFGGVLCFEMEAAGLMNSWPCLVIRGICDYADSHKNKEWQPYAAATAAAFAKELLSFLRVTEVDRAHTIDSVVMEDEG
jgi:nucleoside phosphorylase